MIRKIACLVAEGVIRDADSNTMSVFNILEQLTAEAFPVFVQRLSFFVLWNREADDPDQHQGRFTVALAGKEILAQPVQISFQGKPRNRTTIAIQGLVISNPGPLTFGLLLESGASASYTVDVTAVTSAIQSENVDQPGRGQSD